MKSYNEYLVVYMSDAILPDYSLLLSVGQQQNLQIIGEKVQPLLSYRQHTPLASWANIMKMRYYFRQASRIKGTWSQANAP